MKANSKGWYAFLLAPTTIAEFNSALLNRPVNEVLEEYVLSGDPYAFRGQPNALHNLRAHLSKALNVDENNIVIVGSAQG